MRCALALSSLVCLAVPRALAGPPLETDNSTSLASVRRTIHETRGESAAVFSYLGLQFTS